MARQPPVWISTSVQVIRVMKGMNASILSAASFANAGILVCLSPAVMDTLVTRIQLTLLVTISTSVPLLLVIWDWNVSTQTDPTPVKPLIIAKWKEFAKRALNASPCQFYSTAMISTSAWTMSVILATTASIRLARLNVTTLTSVEQGDRFAMKAFNVKTQMAVLLVLI